MDRYTCRLIDPSGRVLGTVPIIGASEADALQTTQAMFRILGGLGGYELWRGAARLAAHGRATDAPPPSERKTPREG